MSVCRVCPAAIIWAVTANGKAMPVDAEPADGGNVKLTPTSPGQAPRADVLGPMEVALEPDGSLHWPHHATCPNWSKGR